MLDKNNIVPCVDWFRCIVYTSDVKSFVNSLANIDRRLSIDSFICDGRSKLNFSNCWRHIEVPSLSFSFNPAFDSISCFEASLTHNNSGILFELTGDAIRYLGSDSLTRILRILHKMNCKCTRIDYALDFFDRDNDIVPLLQEACSNFMNPGTRDITISGKIKRTPSNFSCYINAYPGADSTINYTLGNHGSDHGMFRLYDKQFETLYGRNRSRAAELMKGDGYWYRAEIELHNGMVLWADDSFHQFVENDFNIYSAIGNAFDMWFAVKIRDFASNSIYSDVDEWNIFIADLVNTIHFVQLVHQKYVNRDTEYAWNQIIHNSTWLSLLLDVGQTDPQRLKDILDVGRVRRQSESPYILKYGSIDMDLDLLNSLFA